MNFDNLTLRKLPVDPVEVNYTRSVADAIYSRVQPTPVLNPKLIVFSQEAASLIGMERRHYADDDNLAELLAGNKLWPGSEPVAHCYAGYQFGAFSGQLGDGAAISLGHVQNWEIQLKGAGLTPYSRTADGRKVLRSSIREFLCSEAMHHLGVPTTRALSVVISDTMVERDPFYDGRVLLERASITTRLAPTFIRFGSFEIARVRDPSTSRSGPSCGNWALLKTLGQFVLDEFYPQIAERSLGAMYKEICRRTAQLVAHWQSIGFCHGVLNTDNMSIMGLTLDYGPFGFMERFKWDHVCNASDRQARYSYANQPEICRWNCEQLARSFACAMAASDQSAYALHEEQLLDILRETYYPTYYESYLDHFRAKLGLFDDAPDLDDVDLVKSLLDTMSASGADFTNTFLALEKWLILEGEEQNLQPILSVCCGLVELRESLKPRLGERQRAALRNLAGGNDEALIAIGAQVVIEDERKLAQLERIRDWDQARKREEDGKLWTGWLASYQTRLNSSQSEQDHSKQARLTLMKSHNPRVILRNPFAEAAIREAEKGHFQPLEHLFQLLRRPFSEESLGVICDDKQQESAKNDSIIRDLVKRVLNNESLPEWISRLQVT